MNETLQHNAESKKPERKSTNYDSTYLEINKQN